MEKLFETKIHCVKCGKLPSYVLESACCKQIFCWSCIEGKTTTCTLCETVLQPSQFQPNDTIQATLERERQELSSSSIRCPQMCGSMIPIKQLNEHFGVCPNWKVHCSCGVSLQRFQMEHHRASCPRLERACEYAPYGCAEMIPNELYNSHLREKQHEHLSMLTRAHQLQSAELSYLRNVTESPMLHRRHSAAPDFPPHMFPAATVNNIPSTNPPVNNVPSINLFNNENANGHVVQNPSPPGNNELLTLEALGTMLWTMVSQRVSAMDSQTVVSFADSAWMNLQVLFNRFLGNRSLGFKIIALLILFTVLKGPAFFLLNVAIFFFVAYAVYQFLATTPQMTSPQTRPFALLMYSVFTFYLFTCLV